MIFHKHKFKKEKNTLWCECGGIKKLPCDHLWEIHAETNIITYDSKLQILQILKCTNCGDLREVNLTTGEIK